MIKAEAKAKAEVEAGERTNKEGQIRKLKGHFLLSYLAFLILTFFHALTLHLKLWHLCCL